MNAFQEFWKSKLTGRELKNIRASIEEKEEEGVRPKKIISSLRSRKKLKEDWKAERVYRTESNRIHSEQVKAGAKKYNKHHFKVLVEKGACELCRSYQNKIFTDKDLVKSTIVPIHPSCRCTLLIAATR